MKQSTRLFLNQETLKNLSEEQLRKIEGGNLTDPPRQTCPDCAPAGDTHTCPPVK